LCYHRGNRKDGCYIFSLNCTKKKVLTLVDSFNVLKLQEMVRKQVQYNVKVDCILQIMYMRFIINPKTI